MSERQNNQGFYDVHCHILPGVDDGAKNINESLEMLKIAYEEGIRHVVLTPHFHVGHYEIEAGKLKIRCESLKEVVHEELPQMKLYSGCEVCFHMEASKRLGRGELLTLAGTSYTLVEFFPKSELSTIVRGLQEIQMGGKWPILAHVERYEALMGNYKAIEEMISMGFQMQVNTSAVVGKDGMRVKRFVKKLLDYELVRFIGTDAHGAKHRRPLMRECADYITKKWGADYTEELLIRNPEKLVQGQHF